jgi:hypothetical protein
VTHLVTDDLTKDVNACTRPRLAAHFGTIP